MGYEFFKEKIIFPSAPVPGINNGQSLNKKLSKSETYCRKTKLSGLIAYEIMYSFGENSLISREGKGDKPTITGNSIVMQIKGGFINFCSLCISPPA